MEFGLYTFGDLTTRPDTGEVISAGQRFAEIVAAAELADQAGFDVFGVGEHHRLDIPISATPVVLGAIAAVTRRIRLTSAVTILSTVDPVRAFEDFATVDVLSGGRAEMIAGRGIFLEPFPLFGHSLDDYDALFAEKLDLFLKLGATRRVSWEGRFRPPLRDMEISPRPVQATIPVWVGSTNPEVVTAAAEKGLPLAIANISQPPAKFVPVVEAYRSAGLAVGRSTSALRVCLAGHLHVAPTSQQALDEFFPHYTAYFREHSPAQYQPRTITRADYEALAGPEGPLFVGSPQQIVDKILWERELFGHQRFLAQADIGGLPYAKVAETIELLAKDVLPAVRNARVTVG